MASLSKKVDIRLMRCIYQLLELRNKCMSRDEARQLEGCITAVRDAKARVGDIFYAAYMEQEAEKLKAPAPAPEREKTQPLGGPVDTRKPKKKPHWSVRELSSNLDDDEEGKLSPAAIANLYTRLPPLDPNAPVRLPTCPSLPPEDDDAGVF